MYIFLLFLEDFFTNLVMYSITQMHVIYGFHSLTDFASFSFWGIPEGWGSVSCNWPHPPHQTGWQSWHASIWFGPWNQIVLLTIATEDNVYWVFHQIYYRHDLHYDKFLTAFTKIYMLHSSYHVPPLPCYNSTDNKFPIYFILFQYTIIWSFEFELGWLISRVCYIYMWQLFW